MPWRSSIQASEEESSVDKVGKVELSDVRASNCDLTMLLLQMPYIIMPYIKLEAHNGINKSAVNTQVHML